MFLHCLLSQQHLCQKLSKLVEICWIHSKPRVSFLRHSAQKHITKHWQIRRWSLVEYQKVTSSDLLKKLLDVLWLIPVSHDSRHMTNADNADCHRRYKAWHTTHISHSSTLLQLPFYCWCCCCYHFFWIVSNQLLWKTAEAEFITSIMPNKQC